MTPNDTAVLRVKIGEGLDSADLPFWRETFNRLGRKVGRATWDLTITRQQLSELRPRLEGNRDIFIDIVSPWTARQ